MYWPQQTEAQSKNPSAKILRAVMFSPLNVKEEIDEVRRNMDNPPDRLKSVALNCPRNHPLVGRRGV